MDRSEKVKKKLEAKLLERMDELGVTKYKLWQLLKYQSQSSVYDYFHEENHPRKVHFSIEKLIEWLDVLGVSVRLRTEVTREITINKVKKTDL
ncbi:MAG: hypothetical protein ACO2ZP_04950 [Bacteriovoracaceae bacterium]